MSSGNTSIGSLFSGIGGLELGLQRRGLGPVKWQVEIEPQCRTWLKKHWPKAKQFDDVRTVGKKNLERVSILCGSSPCQDVSVAGKGKGLHGARSGLWFEYLRIVEEIEPSIIVFENVPGLIRRGLDVIVSGLDGLGYTVEGTRLRASDLGAWHRRERVFLIAYSQRLLVRNQPGWRAAGRVGPVRMSLQTMAARGAWPPSLPTPTARDWKSGASNLHGKNARPLNEVVYRETPGPLNHQFVEFLMGFPIGWLD